MTTTVSFIFKTFNGKRQKGGKSIKEVKRDKR